jgi:hypothetical protein
MIRRIIEIKLQKIYVKIILIKKNVYFEEK